MNAGLCWAPRAWLAEGWQDDVLLRAGFAQPVRNHRHEASEQIASAYVEALRRA